MISKELPFLIFYTSKALRGKGSSNQEIKSGNKEMSNLYSAKEVVTGEK